MRRRRSDTTTIGEMVRGDALVKRLSAGLQVYGFACPTHGLRFYAVVSPGTAVGSEHVHPVEGATLPRPGRPLVCDECGQAMGWSGPVVQSSSMLVPADALDDLETIRDNERRRRNAAAQRGV